MNVKMLKCLDVKMNKGFTLMESLIVMAMVTILTLVTVPFYQSAKAQLSLDRSVSKLAQDIRGVMEKAMSAQNYALCTHVNYKYGYGISLTTGTTGSYILFADCNGDNKYNNSNLDKIIETISFEPGIQLFALSPANSSSLVFIPPDPSVFITSGASSINISIRSSQYTTKQRTISINKVGLIDIN